MYLSTCAQSPTYLGWDVHLPIWGLVGLDPYPYPCVPRYLVVHPACDPNWEWSNPSYPFYWKAGFETYFLNTMSHQSWSPHFAGQSRSMKFNVDAHCCCFWRYSQHMDIAGQIPLFLSCFVASTYPFVCTERNACCLHPYGPMATDNVTQVIYSFASEISDIATVASNKKPCPLVQSSILNCCCVQSNVLSLYATPSVSSWLQPRVPAYSPTFSHVTIAFQCPLLLPLQSSWFNA